MIPGNKHNFRTGNFRRSSAPQAEVPPSLDPNLNFAEMMSQKLIEENTAREKKLMAIFKEFVGCQEYTNIVKHYKENPKQYSPSTVDELWRHTEEISALYNINMSIMTYSHFDSAARFEPIKDRKVMQLLLVCLIPEICKFPYSFYKKVGIRMLSFCLYSIVNNSAHQTLYLKKRWHGLFSLDTENNPERIIKHFYKVIAFHVVATDKNIEAKWKKINSPGFKYGASKAKYKELAEGFLSHEGMKSMFEDQGEIMAALMVNYGNTVSHPDNIVREKAFLLRDMMNPLDKEGMTDEFWLGLDDKSNIMPFKIYA
jgi:uncharacterized short protein YbdD (DUF466 family)